MFLHRQMVLLPYKSERSVYEPGAGVSLWNTYNLRLPGKDSLSPKHSLLHKHHLQ